MKLEILSKTLVQGKPADAGDIVDVKDADMHNLLASGRAKRAAEDAPVGKKKAAKKKAAAPTEK